MELHKREIQANKEFKENGVIVQGRTGESSEKSQGKSSM